MEKTKEFCKCPICNHPIKDEVTNTMEVRNIFLTELYWRTRELVESKNAELAVTEQIRRNCETIVKLMYDS